MALTLTFNQAGLPLGAVDRGRTDILANETPVTITVGSIPDGSLVELTILDEPPGSSPSLSSSSPADWTLTFAAACWGPFRIRATATIGQDVVSAVTRRISIRSPELGIDYPALAERTDPNATSVPTVPSVQLTEMNEGETNRPLVNFHRQLLAAVDNMAASGGGGGGGSATALRTTGASVNVSNADPPVIGQVLTAMGPTTSIWRVPGLTYDPAVRSWTSTTGVASIEPGTWGLVELAPPDFGGPILVSIVSNLDAPPVNSRFGLYIAAAVSVPVQVNVIGASLIMGIDGTLTTTIELIPGAAYEWVLYHEGGAALWGLVSDTSRVAKRIVVAGSILDITGDAPTAGQALLAIDESHLAFGDVASGGGGLMPHPGLAGNPEPGEFVVADGESIVLLPSTTTEGARVAVYAFAECQIQPPDSYTLVFGAASAIGPATLTLPAGAYAEWSLVDFGEGGFVWLAAGASNETVADGGGGTGSDLAYIGGNPYPGAGQWCFVGTADVTLPDDAPLGGTVGMLIAPDRDGATLHVPPAHDLAFGNRIIDGSGTLTLRGGAYYEWTLESVGESTRWLPRRMSSEHPEPLVFRVTDSNPMEPNTWTLADSTSTVVRSPSAPLDGDSFAVLATDDTCLVSIANGQSLLSHDTLTQIEWPTTLEVTGPDYYEWIWSASESMWRPRTSTTMLPPARMLQSGTIVTLSAADTPAEGQVLTMLDGYNAEWRAPPSNGLTFRASGPLEPGEWVRAEDYGGSVQLPAAPPLGAVVAVVMNGSPVTVTPADGDQIASFNEDEISQGPDSLTFDGGIDYLEWIFWRGAGETIGRWIPHQQVTTVSAYAVNRALALMGDPLDVNGQRIANLAAPTDPQDAATKAYVDAIAQGLDVKASCRLVATANVPTLSGSVTIDGVATGADRVLLAAQTTASQNGIWLTSSSGAWARAADADTSAKVTAGMFTFITEGTGYSDTGWVLATNDPITLDTTALAFSQFSSAGQIIDGAGLAKTGNTLNVVANADASIVVNANDIQVGILATDAQHGVRGGGTLHAVATTTVEGFQSGADKDKLNTLSLAHKDPVRVVATATVTAATFGGTATIDGVLVALGDRVLLTSQGDATTHGIWIVSVSPWTRATDADTSAKLPSGAFIPVSEGTTYADSAWILTTNAPIVLGTTSLAFSLMASKRSGFVPGTITAAGAGSPGSAAQWVPYDHSHLIEALDLAFNGFRLSHSTAPIPSDSTTATTVFLVPFTSNRIALNSGGAWYNISLAGTPQVTLSGQTAGVPCDVFAVFGSTTSISLELVPWTDATTRATALAQSSGVWIKAGSITKRYVGTILPNSATTLAHVSAASGASNPICGIWNQDNRIRSQFTWTPTFDGWTIPSADTWQSINAQASAKIQLVQGQAQDTISVHHIAAVNAAGSSACVGIGLDSTTAASGLRDMSSVSGSLVPVRAQLQQRLATPGAHNLNALAIATSTAAIFYGAHGSMQGGLTADLWH